MLDAPLVMIRSESADWERDVHECLASGDVQGAASRIFRVLGAEVADYLAASCRDRETARVAYAQTYAAARRRLPSFHGPGGLRTWLFVVARSELTQVLRDEARRARCPASVETHSAIRHAKSIPAPAESGSSLDTSDSRWRSVA